MSGSEGPRTSHQIGTGVVTEIVQLIDIKIPSFVRNLVCLLRGPILQRGTPRFSLDLRYFGKVRSPPYYPSVIVRRQELDKFSEAVKECKGLLKSKQEHWSL